MASHGRFRRERIEAVKPPDIIFICTDQQRSDSLGCMGNTAALTPHLDALAAEGRNRLARSEDIPASGPEGRNHSLYDDRYRYTWFPHTGERELYDHRTDPSETCNLAENPSHQDTVTRLHQQLVSQFCQDYQPQYGRVSIW